MKDLAMRVMLGFLLIVCGIVCVFIPKKVYSLILDLTVVYCLINCIYLGYLYGRERKKKDLLFALFSFLFVVIIKEYTYIPEWIVRVSFGTYCLVCGLAMFVQYGLHIMNRIRHRTGYFLMGVMYGALAAFLLFSPDFETEMLLRFFGLYFIVLGIQYVHDAYDAVQPSVKYKWKRKFRLMLPPVLCVFMPDWAVQSVNKYIFEGKVPSLYDHKGEEDETVQLKVMVHVGPEGLQKVGHICFAYHDVVYSYGNYDTESFRFNQTLGDGVFFNVPLEKYIPNAMRAENNSIFEYGIHLTKEQRELVEKEIDRLEKRAYRWYCPIEREDGYDRFPAFRDNYPSRLHYRTGAKFYKFKKGKFKTYWVLGDNCASFIDLVLGKLGCDVLSIRGIITPGTYYDFLETEYQKKGSPIVYRTIHPWSREQADSYKEKSRQFS
ncbi:DUF308 domain-containing protein [Erysipelotrichaceae bacterium 66-17]